VLCHVSMVIDNDGESIQPGGPHRGLPGVGEISTGLPQSLQRNRNLNQDSGIAFGNSATSSRRVARQLRHDTNRARSFFARMSPIVPPDVA